MLDQIPSEILTVIIELLATCCDDNNDNGNDIKQLERDVNNVAAVSRCCLAVAKRAKWILAHAYTHGFISSYSIVIVAEYRYANRFGLWRLLNIGGQSINCEHTTQQRAIARITTPTDIPVATTTTTAATTTNSTGSIFDGAIRDINFVCYTPNHGIVYFDLLKVMLMLISQCRWCVSSLQVGDLELINYNNSSEHEILNKGPAVPEYGDESGMHIIDHLTNILNEMRTLEASTMAQLDEVLDGEFGANDDEESAREIAANRMLNAMSEYFRTLIVQYTKYMSAATRDDGFVDVMKTMFDSLRRPRVELPVIGPEMEDLPVSLKNVESVNHQICTFLSAINLSFKFECKVYIKPQNQLWNKQRVYFYQFEKLQDGHYLSRLTQLE